MDSEGKTGQNILYFCFNYRADKTQCSEKSVMMSGSSLAGLFKLMGTIITIGNQTLGQGLSGPYKGFY